MLVTQAQVQALPYKELLEAIADAADAKASAGQNFRALMDEAHRRHDADPQLRAAHKASVDELLRQSAGGRQVAS